jgi:hypothetical protein
MKAKISNAMVFIEALGEHLIGDDRIGYTALGFAVGFAISALLFTTFI